jgi:hypothetical protein
MHQCHVINLVFVHFQILVDNFFKMSLDRTNISRQCVQKGWRDNV